MEVGKAKALAPTLYAGGVVEDVEFVYTAEKADVVEILEGTYSSVSNYSLDDRSRKILFGVSCYQDGKLVVGGTMQDRESVFFCYVLLYEFGIEGFDV